MEYQVKNFKITWTILKNIIALQINMSYYLKKRSKIWTNQYQINQMLILQKLVNKL